MITQIEIKVRFVQKYSGVYADYKVAGLTFM